jgi:hypothetical protein
MAFYNNSNNQVAKRVGLSGRRFVNWWDEKEFERVIAAINAAEPIALSDVEETEDLPAPRAPIKLSASVGSIVEPTRRAAIPGKRRLEDMLREAVANTQRMTPPPEE